MTDVWLLGPEGLLKRWDPAVLCYQTRAITGKRGSLLALSGQNSSRRLGEGGWVQQGCGAGA